MPGSAPDLGRRRLGPGGGHRARLRPGPGSDPHGAAPVLGRTKPQGRRYTVRPSPTDRRGAPLNGG